MTSWAILISADHPGHWEIAKQSGFWDLSKDRAVQAGDLVYFWQAGKSFIAQARATTDAGPITPGMTASWEDSGTRNYVARFEFDVLDENPQGQPQWFKDVGPMLQSGQSPDLRSIPLFEGPDEDVLASYFPQLSSLEAFVWSMLEPESSVDTPFDPSDLNDDGKKVATVVKTVREGREQFREALVTAYDAKCAVTGTAVDPALDAAHIRPYSDPKSNVLPNGLLLRGDIHRLFDKHLLTVVAVDGVHRVRADPILVGTPYGPLDGQPLASLPAEPSQRPNSTLLAEHNERCSDWLVL